MQLIYACLSVRKAHSLYGLGYSFNYHLPLQKRPWSVLPCMWHKGETEAFGKALDRGRSHSAPHRAPPKRSGCYRNSCCPDSSAGHVASACGCLLGDVSSRGREEVLEIGSEPCHCKGLTTTQILSSQSSQGKIKWTKLAVCPLLSKYMAYFSNCTGWPSKATISAEELHYSRKRWNPPFLALVI